MEERHTRSRARAVGLPLGRDTGLRFELDRLVPSTRSIVAGITLLAVGLAGFVLVRQSSLFAVRTIDVVGATPALERQVRAALSPLVGENLAALDGGDIADRLSRLREIRGLRYDRAFPNTLTVFVRPDPPVALLQSGRHAWFVSARGVVVRPLTPPLPRRWPRVWVARAEAPTRPAVELPPRAIAALRALGGARRARSSLRGAVRTVTAEHGRVTFVLRSGLELRLGSASDVGLKLAVAARLLRTLTRGERERIRYVDLSVPSRPVTGRYAQP